MQNLKNRFYQWEKTYLPMTGICLLLLLALLLLWFNNANSSQAINAMIAQVRFEGEYCVGDGSWQTIEAGKHIPATKGDVTLRGNFHMYTPDGEYVGIYDGELPVALYSDHISLTVTEGDNEPSLIDAENLLYGDSDLGCAG